MDPDRLRHGLRDAEVPDRAAAEERSWRVVRAALAEREGAAPRRRAGAVLARLAAAVALGAAIVALAMSPAGAEVRDWMADAVDGEPAPRPRALTELPAPGELLVESQAGAWLVRADGSRRLLGDYRQATFSPRGLNIAAVGDGQLVAIDPQGEPQWSLPSERRIADPRWAPSGYRVAFRNGSGLDVIAGDGTAPRALAAAVSPVAPTWRPSPDRLDPRYEPNVLSYADRRGRIVTVDVDSGERLWRTGVRGDPELVEWADSDTVAVATRDSVRLLDRSGRPTGGVPLPRASTVDSMAPSPDGNRLAIVLEGDRGDSSRLLLARIDGGPSRERTVFSGLGRGGFGTPAFSPDGEWILLPWPDTDQWLFISPSRERKRVRRVISATGVSRQFDPGGRGAAEFPTVAGWCCS